MSVLNKRCSIRKFQDKPVDGALVKEVIRLGTLAPTACNRQGWRFIIVTDKDIMARVRKCGGSKIIPTAPIGVVVLYNKFTINLHYEDNIESASACIENMLLAATNIGLGACWIGNLPKINVMRRLFNVPKRYDIIAYIAFGYPEFQSDSVPRKYSNIDELISYNMFSMEKEIEIRKISKLQLSLIFVISKFHISVPGFIRKKIKDIMAVDHK
ncbi:MAG: nitroreductase family protein [Candidatus Omnitrophica bacterium]|nr:nitroreductase family protein [Candidatus Omnitrophota bacterium]